MMGRSVSLEGTMEKWSSMSSAVGLLFLFILNGVTLLPQYSETSISSEDKPHYECNNTGNWSGACGRDPKLITIPNKLKKYIVSRHNTFRDIVASGTHLQLPAAGRMCKLSWDTDLADAAKLLVMRCDLRPTNSCISTTKFPTPGYNAVYYKFPKKQNAFRILRSQLDAWYDQHKYIQPLDILDGLSLKKSDGGHFQRMMVGPSNHLGCAMAETEKYGWIYQWLICLYSCSPKNNTILYEYAAKPGSFCTTGVDGKFQHLCSDQEVVDTCKLTPLFKTVISNDTSSQINSRSYLLLPVPRQWPPQPIYPLYQPFPPYPPFQPFPPYPGGYY